jgi:hypothetical protein
MAKKVRYDDYPERDELRRRSYTDFSSSFPGEATGRPRASREERERKQRSMLTVLAVVGCLGIVFFGFFITLVMLSVSRQEPSSSEPDVSNTVTQSPTVTEKPTAITLDKIRAITAPEAALGGGAALETLLDDAKSANCGAVVFILKSAEGNVLYPSELEQAKKGNILKKSYAAAKNSINAAKQAGLQVILRISCFRDALAPALMLDAAVRYSKDTGVLWLDDYPDRGGKPWLNPYSNYAQNYLLGIIREAAAMKPDAIYLTGVQFPSGAQSLSTFPGENSPNAPTRNVQLLQFIKDVKTVADDIPLLCEMDAQAALQTAGAAIYGGDLWQSEADALVISASGAVELKLLQTAAPKGKAWLPQMKAAEGSDEFILE